jgi:hypothetical protein
MEEDQPPTSPPPPPQIALNAPAAADDQLLVFVRDRDAACPLCGYNLRALTVPRCPECGQALKLTVALAEPFLKAWITCTAATCLSAGAGVLILIVLMAGGGTPNFSSTWQALNFFSFPAMIPIAAILLLGRRRFLRWKRERQSLITALIVAATILQFAFIFTWIR